MNLNKTQKVIIERTVTLQLTNFWSQPFKMAATAEQPMKTQTWLQKLSFAHSNRM